MGNANQITKNATHAVRMAKRRAAYAEREVGFDKIYHAAGDERVKQLRHLNRKQRRLWTSPSVQRRIKIMQQQEAAKQALQAIATAPLYT